MEKDLREFGRKVSFLIPSISREIFKKQQKILSAA